MKNYIVLILSALFIYTCGGTDESPKKLNKEPINPNPTEKNSEYKLSTELKTELSNAGINTEKVGSNEELYKLIISKKTTINTLNKPSKTIIQNELLKLSGVKKVKALKSIGYLAPKLSFGNPTVTSNSSSKEIKWTILCDGKPASTFKDFLHALEFDLSNGDNSKMYKFIKNLDSVNRFNGVKNDYGLEINNRNTPYIRVYTTVLGPKKNSSWVNMNSTDNFINNHRKSSNYNDKLSIVNSRNITKDSVKTVAINSRSGNRLVIFRNQEYITLSHLKDATKQEILEYWRRALFQIKGYGGKLSEGRPKINISNLERIGFHSGRRHNQSVSLVHLRLEVNKRFTKNILVDCSDINN